jgi:hypothetical protein
VEVRNASPSFYACSCSLGIEPEAERGPGKRVWRGKRHHGARLSFLPRGILRETAQKPRYLLRRPLTAPPGRDATQVEEGCLLAQRQGPKFSEDGVKGGLDLEGKLSRVCGNPSPWA